MKKRVILFYIFMITTFIYAETFKGVFGFNLNESKEKIINSINKKEWFIEQKNPNYFVLSTREGYHKQYATHGVKDLSLVFWEEKLVWIDIRIYDGTEGRSFMNEIISAIIQKYDFEIDYRNSTDEYTNYINEKTGIEFGCEKEETLLYSYIDFVFTYLNKFLEYKEWRNKWETQNKQKALNDSI